MKDERLIQDWLSDQDVTKVAALEKAIALTEKLEVPSKTDKALAWGNLLDRINEETHDNQKVLVPHKRSNRWLIWVASTAAIFLIGYFGLKNTPQPALYSTEATASMSQTLPDNSIVVLNANSEISYVEKHWDNNRTIHMEGEAFFDVQKGTQFTVVTDIGNIKVLGTSFNVFARENGLEVSCATGKVVVEAGGKEVILNPGNKAVFTPSEEGGSLESQPVNINEIGSWRSGDFYYELTALQKVIDEMERQFGIEIIVSTDVSQRFYSGYFSNSDLKEALQLVFVPMGLTYVMDENQVTVQ